MTDDVISHWGMTSKNLQVICALPTLMDICSSSFSPITDSLSCQILDLAHGDFERGTLVKNWSFLALRGEFQLAKKEIK